VSELTNENELVVAAKRKNSHGLGGLQNDGVVENWKNDSECQNKFGERMGKRGMEPNANAKQQDQ
jgi:hypothetical protein